MRGIVISLLCFFALSSWADEVSLVRVSEVWRFLRGTNEPSLTSDWRLLHFDDSRWSQGPSGFGFSDGDDATYLADMWYGYPSLYLRKIFFVQDTNAIAWLILRVDYQDGFVAYLNGTEIARRSMPGMPGSFVPFNTFATWHFAGVAEDIDVSAYAKLLVRGENVLAIQGHRASMDSYGFTINPELLANFNRGPFLQCLSSNQVHIHWKTPVAANSQVAFGTNFALTQSQTNATLDTNHVVILTNLLPDTLYYYRISSNDGNRTGTAPTFQFRTMAMQGGFSFVVIGDSGSGNIAQYRMAAVMQETRPDMFLHAGDLVYPQFTSGRADLKFFSIYYRMLRSLPFYIALGNHERYANHVDYPATFDQPTNTLTGTELFYSFDNGDAHFTVLDTDLGQGNDWSVGKDLYQWLENDLASSRKPWKFLLFHNALHTSGIHRFDNYNLNQIADRLELQNSIEFLASRYGARVLFTAHDHLYERLNPVGGVHSIVSGGGGGVLYPFCGQWDEANCQFWSRFNCLHARFQGGQMEIRGLGYSGEVFDSMYISQSPPSREEKYTSYWHTLRVENTDANDGDGNIIGQRFEAIGSGIPTVTGQYSNLGRMRVNNDSNTLYLCLDQAMIYNTNLIFLFVESPGLVGVTNLAGLGNNKADPDSQGADGLDFLENLQFTNFTPAIGCILGDEFADGQYRSYGRTNMTWNAGQGVFYLDRDLTDVPGVRLQQFNLSSSSETAPWEENANFIEIAIPYSSLGSLKPGDTLRVGAVVSGNQRYGTNHCQGLWLDSSFLGCTLQTTDKDLSILEGVSVRLAMAGDPQPDTDHDGLPDAWERQYGLDPFWEYGINGAEGDPDQDGMNNLAEYLAGTSPIAADSKWRLRFELTANNRLRLFWNAVPGISYTIEQSDKLNGKFLPLPDPAFPRIANAGEEFYDLEISGPLLSTRQRFYRVKLMK